MSKKDYEVLAAALRSSKPDAKRKAALEQWEKDVDAISKACGNDNPRFDYGRFARACRGE